MLQLGGASRLQLIFNTLGLLVGESAGVGGQMQALEAIDHELNITRIGLLI